MRPFRLPVVAAVAAVVLLAGCRIPVKTDYDPATDFAQLASFGWLEPPLREAPGESEAPDPFVRNTLLDKRVRDAVTRELAARGYRHAADDETPDFLVRYQVVAKQVTRDRPVVVGGGFGYGRYPFGYGSSVAYGADSYEEGTLILDVIDPETDSIAWRGWAAARTDDGYFDAGRVDRYVHAILERFPPPDR